MVIVVQRFEETSEPTERDELEFDSPALRTIALEIMKNLHKDKPDVTWAQVEVRVKIVMLEKIASKE
jgi:hypothetical protein